MLTKNRIYGALLICLFMGLRTDIQAQTEGDTSATPSDEEMMATFLLRFDMTLPDTTFTEMDDSQGWQETATKSKLGCMALPVSYEQMLKDTQEISSLEGGTLISKQMLELGGVKGFLAKLEFTLPEGQGEEPYFVLMYIRPWSKSVTLSIGAAYPKSQDARLYSKMLASFATVRKKE